VGGQEKQVCGSEAMVVGMGCHTDALCAGCFYSYFFFGSAKQKFIL